ELVDELAPLRAGALDGHPWAEWAAAGSPLASAGAPPAPGANEPSSGEAAPRRMPGAQSRWNAKKDQSWEPLRPELVAEVAFDHLQGDRFRHATHFQRWRPDRRPQTCTYAQLEVVVPEELASVFGA
nr:hypothetical protein [Acidimicrobiia bacterium]